MSLPVDVMMDIMKYMENWIVFNVKINVTLVGILMEIA